MRDFSDKVFLAHSYIKEINTWIEQLQIIKPQVNTAVSEKEKSIYMIII